VLSDHFSDEGRVRLKEWLYVSYHDIMSTMETRITGGEYQALVELRYRVRRFLRDGDPVARRVALPPQQYILKLAIRGLPRGYQATIRTLAQRMALKHHAL
jgi:hypothetical protein